MTGFREYHVTDEAVEQAERLGMSGNVRERLKQMARRSANITHPLGNRRFDGFLLWITNGCVTSITPITE